jgi:tetratricopeptide (TPR) repeat protein
MIVKNEAKVILRCLDSVRPFIQRWVIVDTGSTDGTQELVRKRLADIPGELHERPWQDFGHNRSEALRLARDAATDLLVIDADEVLRADPGFVFPAGAELYMAPAQIADTPYTWYRPLLLDARLPWRYEGVVHEQLLCGRDVARHMLTGIRIISHSDGARNADQRQKFLHDARTLERALRKQPNDARYVFYLAQSYRDAEEYARALPVYERRAAMGGWDEEVYASLYQVADLHERLKHDPAVVAAAYQKANHQRPSRAEPLVALAALHRAAGQWPQAEALARRAAALPRPPDLLAIDDSVYTWRATDELAIATYYTQKYAESAALNRALLAGDAVPPEHRPRIQKNLEFALARLPAPAPAIPRSAAPLQPAQARVAYTSCPLCRSPDLAPERVADCRNHPLYKPELPAEMRWLRCRACDHVFTAGYFSERALEVLFAHANPGQRPGWDVHGSRVLSSRIVEKVRAALGGVRGTWLDVGFGNGALLGTAAEYGYDVVGLDLRRENVEAMRRLGVEAHTTELTQYRPAAPLAVVSMADVLEHMAFPGPALTHTREILADDGVLFVSMPNSDCFAWKYQDREGTNPYWAELEHYHNFGRRRLHAFLAEHGFEPVSYGISERYYLCMEVIARKQRPTRTAS